MDSPGHLATVKLPRVAITYCTQCRWMLRAAYFGQELLSTFGTSIGEIALIPATGGTFIVKLTYKPVATAEGDPDSQEISEAIIWDYKTERGFPETKILKQKIRNFIDPGRSLGHSDKPSSKVGSNDGAASKTSTDGTSDSGDVPTAGKISATDDTVTADSGLSGDGAFSRSQATSQSHTTDKPTPHSETCKDCD